MHTHSESLKPSKDVNKNQTLLWPMTFWNYQINIFPVYRIRSVVKTGRTDSLQETPIKPRPGRNRSECRKLGLSARRRYQLIGTITCWSVAEARGAAAVYQLGHYHITGRVVSPGCIYWVVDTISRGTRHSTGKLNNAGYTGHWTCQVWNV